MSILSTLLITSTALTGFYGANANIDCNQAANQAAKVPQKVIISQSAVKNNEQLKALCDKLGIDPGKLNGCITGGGSNGNQNQNGGQNQGGGQNQNGGQENPDSQSYAAQVVSLVNAERAKHGLAALTMKENISSAANVRAKEIVQSFSHTRPDGRAFSTALAESGVSFKSAGENIAWGQRTPAEVVNAWMNSDGHRENILSSNYTSIGVGYYVQDGAAYWAQLFTS